MTIPSKIFHEHSIHNSMDWAKDHIKTAPDGSLFLANIHETTRGRQGRTWQFSPKQIVLTLLLKPQIISANIEQELRYLNMAISIGVAHALEKYNVGLKWPNDFVVDNKKLGGMLLESVWKNNELTGIIAGIAINGNNEFSVRTHSTNAPGVAKAMPDRQSERYQCVRPACRGIAQRRLERNEMESNGYERISLKEITGSNIDLQIIQTNILKSLDSFYEQFKQKKFDDIFLAWKKLQVMLNKQITIHTKNGEFISGIAESVHKNGDLILKTEALKTCVIPFYIIEQINLS